MNRLPTLTRDKSSKTFQDGQGISNPTLIDSGDISTESLQTLVTRLSEWLVVSSSKPQSDELQAQLDHWVVSYLQTYPRFFEDKEALLKSMLLSHPHSGKTVSLLERQLLMLRQQSHDYASKVSRYELHATANAEVFQKVETFSARLMATQTLQQAVDCIYEQMQCLFGVDETSLHSFEMPSQSVDGLKQLGMTQRWVQALSSSLKLHRPVCGPIEQAWRSGLFYQHQDIASLCIVPLGESRIWGVMALGSLDAKFNGDETLFLKFLGRLVTAKLGGVFDSECVSMDSSPVDCDNSAK